MNLEELLKLFNEKLILAESKEENNKWAIIGMPIWHLGHPDSIAIKLTYKDDKLIVSDCHTTMDYLYADNIDLDDYHDKLTKIMQKFNIYQDGDVFRKIIHDHTNPFREIGYFLEAIAIIANINL